jgi:hypothetical protein
MKYSLSAILILFFTIPALAQSVSVRTTEATRSELTVTKTGDAIMLEERNGEVVKTLEVNAEADDPSFKVYPLVNGGYLVRENIANFLIVDSFGSVKKSISNSTQSEEGESMSELAMDPFGKTVVVYNPKVNMNGKTGSRAKFVDSKTNPVDVFYSDDRMLSNVFVSTNGEFVAFVSSKSGTDDEVRISDRFGNILNTISFDQEVKGVSFSENGWYITIYSGGRMAAYEVRSAKRMGSSSVRNTSIQFATYIPEDNTILALSGKGTSRLSDLEIRAINVSARKVATEDMGGTLESWGKAELNRTAKGRYTINGFSKVLSVSASF